MQDTIRIEPTDRRRNQVVKFTDKISNATAKTEETDFSERLLKKYRAPASLSEDDSNLEKLNRDNYKSVMHKMLYLEEKECNRKISRSVVFIIIIICLCSSKFI